MEEFLICGMHYRELVELKEYSFTQIHFSTPLHRIPNISLRVLCLSPQFQYIFHRVFLMVY